MKSLQKIYSLVGRSAYNLSSPLVRLWVGGSQRAYVVLVCGNEVLLIKNWFGKQEWHLPGGGRRQGESGFEAAMRELVEELGVSLTKQAFKPLTQGVWLTNNYGYKYEIMRVNLNTKPVLKPKRPEVLEVAWFKLASLPKANLPAEITAALSKL